MQHCRTIKEPRQAIPTFRETIALLTRPENRHVKFDVRALLCTLEIRIVDRHALRST